MTKRTKVFLSCLLSASLIGCGSSADNTTSSTESSAEAETAEEIVDAAEEVSEEAEEIVEAVEETPEVAEEVNYANLRMPNPIDEPDVLYYPYEEVKEYVEMLADAISAGVAEDMAGVSNALIDTGFNETLYDNDIGKNLHSEATEYTGFWTIDENETYIRYQYYHTNGAVSYKHLLDYRPKDGGTGFFYYISIDEGDGGRVTKMVTAETSGYLFNGSFTEFYESSEADGTVPYTSKVTGSLVNEYYDGLIYKEAEWPTFSGMWENTEIMFDNGTPVEDYYTDENGNAGTGHKTGVDGMGREVDELAPSYYPGMYPVYRSVA